MKSIATRGRSYGEFLVGACLSREGWGFGFAVSGFRLSVAEPNLFIWSERKMKSIATRGRSYGGGSCRSVLVTRRVGVLSFRFAVSSFLTPDFKI